MTKKVSRYASAVPRRPKKPPWNAGLVFPDSGKQQPKPWPDTVSPSHSTTAAMGEQECLRCLQLLDGRKPSVPDHSLRCPYRGTGRDPDPKG